MTAEASAFTGSIPEFYDRYLVPVIFEPYARDLERRFRASGARAVLELACGTGAVTQHLLAALPPDGLLTATDLNAPMLELTRQRVGADRRVVLQTVDATELPFLEHSFDIVLCQFGWMFFPDKLVAARQARRVLNPGGKLVFNVWDGFENNAFGRITHETLSRLMPGNPPPFYLTPFGWRDRSEIRAAMDTAGFRDVTIDPLRFDTQSASARDFAIGLVRGNPVVQSVIEAGLDPLEVEARVAEALARVGGEKPWRSSIQALVVTAR